MMNTKKIIRGRTYYILYRTKLLKEYLFRGKMYINYNASGSRWLSWLDYVRVSPRDEY